MSKPEEPLNEISLNTPAGKHNALLTMSSKKAQGTLCSKEAFDLKGCVTAGYVDSRLERISMFLKQRGSKIEARQSFAEIYRALERQHSLSGIRHLVKQHLSFIVSLLNTNQQLEAAKEITYLYNETNTARVNNLHELLLADYTTCNDYYLSTLKILTMQVILKTKTTSTYRDTLLLFYSMDRRYLLKDSKLKIHNAVKLLLNFYTQLPEIKLLFGLKFLQYVRQFNLSFETYVKNMDLETFKQQLIFHASKSEDICKTHMNSFYSQYTKFFSTGENTCTIELLEHFKFKQDMEGSLLELDVSALDSHIRDYDMNATIVLASQYLKNTDISILNILKFLNILWSRIRLNGQDRDKSKIQLLDSTLIFLNANIRNTDMVTSEFYDLLTTLSECCFDVLEYKRLGNIGNILFNGFVVLRDYKLMRLAANIENRVLLMSSDHSEKNFRKKVQKFERFISNISDLRQKLEIFSYIFNIHSTVCDDSLSKLQARCQYIYLKCYPKLKLSIWTSFIHCSEVMLALYYARSPLKNSNITSWSPMTRMLYSCLSGEYYLGSIEINPESNKWHFLYKYEVLIKASYCFNLEMSKHSTSNLMAITKSYMEKWISTTLLIKDRISSFEVEFLRMLFQYLEFNNFGKLLIDLIGAIQSIGTYFSPLASEVRYYQLSAYSSLHLANRIASIKNSSLEELDIPGASWEDLICYLGTRLTLHYWDNDAESFEELFLNKLLHFRREIYDIDNKNHIPMASYVKILLFNVKALMTASKLHMNKNDMISAVTESKKALKLAISLLKQIEKLSQGSRLRLIECLAQSYICLIEIYIHVGITRDCEFYVEELSRVICQLREPTIVFHCLAFLFQYYNLTGQKNLQSAALKKSNKTFEYIDGQSNILALTTFFFMNNERDKILESLKLFFGSDIEETFLPDLWKVKLGQAIDDHHCPVFFKSINSINKINNQYQDILKSLEKDPFFKNVFESLLAIPSCHLPEFASETDFDSKAVLETPRKSILKTVIAPSSRPSNMTPRGKHLRQKFDKAAAISNLSRLKHSIEILDLAFLKNEDLSKVACLYSLSLSLLSNLDTTPLSIKDLFEEFALSELPKSLPMYYDKKLSIISNEIYENYGLLPLKEFANPILDEKKRLLQAQKNIAANKTAFNIISLDFCPVTENLLLSRTDSRTNRKVHIRIPLNRAYSRDLDSMNLTFEEAKSELLKIIEESNTSTSFEVTSSINSKEERKKWWNTRHNLDARLEQLLSQMEKCWFNSFKAFFSPEIADQQSIDNFREKLNQILHQNLPSRKQYGKPESFIQIEDWIIEWIMKLDPQDTEFLSMVEDLVYFILDILLFHGEENAYDEIDFSAIHIKVEEQIRKYQAQIKDSERFQHTFLMVSGSLHMFPWECLSFFRSLSITRIPSYGCLDELLKGSNNEVFPEVSLQSSVSIILNPHGDLSKTESRFSAKFERLVGTIPNSSLIVNEKPNEQIFLQKLIDSNIFIYLGHGGGEQYARLKEIKRLNSIAPSFLLGCSSAFMGTYGKLEPTGTIYTYLLAGCPLVLGNLWDVTDKDIDKFSERVFEEIGLLEKDVESSELLDQESVISTAVAKSRDVCYLKYLNGAAPVAYGLPIRFI